MTRGSAAMNAESFFDSRSRKFGKGEICVRDVWDSIESASEFVK